MKTHCLMLRVHEIVRPCIFVFLSIEASKHNCSRQNRCDFHTCFHFSDFSLWLAKDSSNNLYHSLH